MLMGVQINWLAVVVSAVAAMVIGSIWFGPMFGKMYISLMGMDNMSPEQQAGMKKGMMGMYFWQFVASIVTAVVLTVFIGKTGGFTAMHGLKVALAAWFGFIVTTKLGDWLWGGKKQLFFLAVGNSLITYAVTGLILGAWK